MLTLWLTLLFQKKMTDIYKLYEGIGAIIDDALDTDDTYQSDDIWKIKASFEDLSIPILTFTGFPDKVNYLSALSFLVLDWNLYEIEPGVPIPQELLKDNVIFIQEFREVAFCPIFIFSNEDPNTIIVTLEESGLYDRTRSNNIFVKRKSEVDTAGKLFQEIESWTKSTPSIYVLKEWEYSLKKAKNSLFWDFYNTTSNWPKVLQETFITDGVDKNHELNHIIYKNLIARTTPIEFDEDVLAIVSEADLTSKEEIRKVLECERYISNINLPVFPATGDLYREGRNYFLNIRPDCDILRKGDDVSLYLIKGKAIKEVKINKEGSQIQFCKGNFIEKVNNAYVSFVDEQKIIEFKFNEIEIKSFSAVKDNRIGRLLPPYITRIQQKYSFYLQRQALPAIPDRAIGL